MQPHEIDRRALLRGTVLVGGVTATGYASARLWDWLAALGCPGPSEGERLSSEAHGPEQPRPWPLPSSSALELVTTADELDRLALDGLSDTGRSRVESTDFETAFLLGLNVTSRPGEYHFVGVERLDDGIVRAFSCVPNPSQNDEGLSRFVLVRVHTEVIPDTVRHVFTVGSERRVAETTN